MDADCLNGDMFQVFITQFCAREPSRFHIMILDNASFHRKKALVIPPNLLLIFLPPYTPELNPVERFWLEVKRVLKNQVFGTLEDSKDAVFKRIESFTPEALQTLAGYPYLKEAWKRALSPG